MRKCSEVVDFPYTARHCCLFEIKKDNSIEKVVHYRKMDYENVKSAYLRAKNNESKLYYVWPGEYTSDLFFVDDLSLFFNAFNINLY